MKKPILIGGCGSSGTTLLRKILNSHPAIACGAEMSVFDRPLMYLESIDYLYTLWRAQDFDPLDKYCIFPLRVTNRYGDFSYCGLFKENGMRHYHSPDEVEQMFSESDTIMQFLELFFRKWAEKQGKPRWAEKTPNNIFCMDNWLDAYQDGIGIVMIRDGRDVVLSLNHQRKSLIYVAVYRWIASMNKYLELKNGDLARRIIGIKYEHLVREPEKVLKYLCSLIGIRYDSCMLEFYKESSDDDGDLKYGTSPISDENVGRWKRNDYDHTILEQIQVAIKPQMEQLGYEIK